MFMMHREYAVLILIRAAYDIDGVLIFHCYPYILFLPRVNYDAVL